MIDIKDLPKEKVLSTLYSHARLQGLGFFSAKGELDDHELEILISKTKKFDVLYGRSLHVDISGDEFDPDEYDRFNGKGSAVKAIISLKKELGLITDEELEENKND